LVNTHPIYRVKANNEFNFWQAILFNGKLKTAKTRGMGFCFVNFFVFKHRWIEAFLCL